MKNHELAHEVIQKLVNYGVREFILCAGARNSPFVFAMADSEKIKIYSFFEERSAAFFALGRIAQTQRPVAVLTTSGTAVAELLPAAIEATYSSLSLVLVTADRPKNYRGSGAPQSIEQVGIFSHYTQNAFDIDVQHPHFELDANKYKVPIHINVCFDEPLIDGSFVEYSIDAPQAHHPFVSQIEQATALEHFLTVQKPLVLLGPIPHHYQQSVLDFLLAYQAPIYAETISGLRGHPQLKDLEIKSGDKMALFLLEQGHCDSVLRIGGVPTLRLWRDLEDKLKHVPVMSVSYNGYSGLSRPSIVIENLEELPFTKKQKNNFLNQQVKDKDQLQVNRLQQILEKFPQSEPSLVWKLSQKLKSAHVYLGNSLPIRQWDLAASRDVCHHHTFANRGANGIDGQISSFLGWAQAHTTNWCVIGDLTAMYDLSSLWATRYLTNTGPLRIVIINNQGGQIFQRMFKHELFINRHDMQFSNWAKMWGWSYQLWQDIPQEVDTLAQHQVLELRPDPQQTELFWQEWEQAWKA